MKIVATIEARMGSSRLPGKILKNILDKPTLELLVERVRKSKHIEQVVVATTVDPSDNITEENCRKIGIDCFRGSSEDVLNRVLQTAKAYQADLIVELTGDCPLLDPEIIDSVIEKYLSGSFDYVSNVLERTYPRGLDTQVFSTAVLEKVSQITQDPADRENVSLYIYENPEQFKLGNVKASSEHNRPDLRLTVDTVEDFKLISSIYNELYPKNKDFNLSDVIKLLNQKPELSKLNADVQQKKAR